MEEDGEEKDKKKVSFEKTEEEEKSRKEKRRQKDEEERKKVEKMKDNRKKRVDLQRKKDKDNTAILGKTLVVLSDSHITPSRYFFIVNLTLFKAETEKIVLKIVRITRYQSFRHNQKRKTTSERLEQPPLRP